MRLTPQQIAELLPPPPQPAADYLPVREAAGMLHVAGQTPHIAGDIAMRGVVGESVAPEDARDLARTAVLNAVSALQQHLGDLDRISHFVSLTVFVAALPTFTRHPWVADGASNTLVELFGEAGRHARAAVGVASLPDGAPVEVSVIAYAEPLPKTNR
ncbi:RidA family protein [Leucobacter sp. gxy201]|uniref:RidA family protein n=1 Tax=Leucobacter sp. gxy201 TaxID=2957200 RepID=UPI003DA09ABF